MIPWQFHAIIDDQLYRIKIEITCKTEIPETTSLLPEIVAPSSKVDTSALVGQGTMSGSARVGLLDRPNHGVIFPHRSLEELHMETDR